MTVGNLLRERREELGYNLPEMADYLRIRLPYLEAIEQEAFRELPGSAYAIGFIKTYSKALGFDEEQVAANFRKEQAYAAQRPALTMRAPSIESRVPTLPLLVAAVVLIVLVWIGWAMLHPVDRSLTEAIPPVPDRLQPQPPANAAATMASVATPEEQEEAHNDMPAATLPVLAPAVPAQPSAAVNYNDTASSPAGHLRIVASEDAWVQVYDPLHKIIFTRVLHPGDSYDIPGDSGYSFDTGNAGGVKIVTNGIEGPTLGETGIVMRNVPLEVSSASANAAPHP